MLTNQFTSTVFSFQITPVVDPRIKQRVWVNGKLGIIVSIVISPYWTETKQGIQRAFVVSKDTENDYWTSYELLDELDFGTMCLDCGKEISEACCCGECGRCAAHCCSCPAPFEPLELDEQLDREYAQWLDSADSRYEEMMEMRAMREGR